MSESLQEGERLSSLDEKALEELKKVASVVSELEKGYEAIMGDDINSEDLPPKGSDSWKANERRSALRNLRSTIDESIDKIENLGEKPNKQ